MIEKGDVHGMMMNPYIGDGSDKKTEIEGFYDGSRYHDLLDELDNLTNLAIDDRGLNGSALENIRNHMKMFKETYDIALGIGKTYGVEFFLEKKKKKFDRVTKNLLKLCGGASDE